MALGTSADTNSTVWFGVAKGVTTEVFYPRLDIPNIQDMQYVVTDGSMSVGLKRGVWRYFSAMIRIRAGFKTDVHGRPEQTQAARSRQSFLHSRFHSPSSRFTRIASVISSAAGRTFFAVERRTKLTANWHVYPACECTEQTQYPVPRRHTNSTL